ncbi:MAG: GNAT family N-acetyltransferase [Clostridiales bacterium]|nr:GNAT family N-acetyltransferase [Clostridiales bacterium]
MRLRLIRPSAMYRTQITEMMDEWFATGEKIVPWTIRRVDYRSFDAYIKDFERETVEPSVAGVMAATYFALNEAENKIVGAVNIRHDLNDSLLRSGGHIGDGVRPSERRKGYATEIISLALDKCRDMGIEKVLITCDKSNIGSAKSIMSNGGILQDEHEVDGVMEQRYWIVLQV